jgi:hypothetical protein
VDALDSSPETGDYGALAAGHPRFTLKLLSAYMSGVGMVHIDDFPPLSALRETEESEALGTLRALAVRYPALLESPWTFL